MRRARLRRAGFRRVRFRRVRFRGARFPGVRFRRVRFRGTRFRRVRFRRARFRRARSRRCRIRRDRLHRGITGLGPDPPVPGREEADPDRLPTYLPRKSDPMGRPVGDIGRAERRRERTGRSPEICAEHLLLRFWELHLAFS
ncbi:MAG: pentapeptide repeat-containing protein [Eubacteriales bacterium]